MIQYNAPKAARDDVNENTNVSSRPKKMYKPLPHKVKEQATNELYIPLFQPDLWQLFNNDANEAERLGLNAGNPLVIHGQSPVYTYHFKVPVHEISKYERPDGTTGFVSFICPNEFNKYLTNIWQRSPLFKKADCPFCKARNLAWKEHNDRWEVVLIEKGLPQKPKDDSYKAIVKDDPILNETYNRAKSFSLHEKHVVDVVDYGKVTQKVPLEEGEELSHQYWMIPQSVLKTLNVFYENAASEQRNPFFVHDPEGLKLIKVIKDTSKCSGNNFRDTSYTVMEGPTVKMDEAWFNFMTNLSSMADPSEVITILPYDEMVKYSTVHTTSVNVPAEVPAQSMNQYMNAPAPNTTVQAPPTVAPASAPATVQAPPVATAPSVTSAPPASAPEALQAPPAGPPTMQAPPPASAPPVTAEAPPAGPMMAPPVPAMDSDESFDAPDRGDASDQTNAW